MRKLFQTINKGEFEAVKQIIIQKPEENCPVDSFM